jgi:hypothetical protein
MHHAGKKEGEFHIFGMIVGADTQRGLAEKTLAE